MPDAIITSTASTFGTITGTFAADQSTITGTIAGVITGTLTGTVGIPGPQGPAGPGSTWGGIAGTLSNQLDLQAALDLKAPLASPLFTGDPRGPTAPLGDSDTSLATTAFVQQELASGTAVAKNLEVYVRNQTGSTLAAGAIVYINGATGNRPTVTLAQANNDANSAQTFGFVKASIANNGFGYVIVRGELENVDTQALTEGVQLYLSPTTPGAWTTTKPSAPQHLVYVGIVVRSHPTQGVILVAVQNGYELDELHDVSIVSKANNDLIAYDSATTLWKNKSIGTLGLATQAWVDAQGYLQAGALTGYALESWVTSGFYPLTGNPSGFLTSSALTPYLAKADNLGSLTNFATARDNLGLGSLSSPTFASVTVQGSGSNVANLTPTSLSLTHATAGTFTIQPTVGITFPDSTVQTTAFTGSVPGYITSVSSPLSVTSGNLTIDLSAYLTSATAASTYQTIAGMSSYLTTSAAASTYYPLTNPAGYITSSALAPYLTSATAASTYYPLTNPAGYITSSALTGYATESWVTSQGYITSAALTPYLTSSTAASTYQTLSGMSSYLTTSAAASTYRALSNNTFGNIGITAGNALTIDDGGSAIGETVLQNAGLLIRDTSNVPLARFQYDQVLLPSAGLTFSDATTQTSAGITAATADASYYPLTGNPSSFLVAADIAGKANTASPALTGNVTITTNSTSPALFIEQSGTGNILTLHDQASDTTFVAIDQSGKVNTIPSTTANAGFNVPHGTAPTSPVNGDVWTTTGGIFWRQNGTTQQAADLGSTQTISGAKTFSASSLTFGSSTSAGTINVATGAIASGIKTVNIGSAGTSGSTTNINIGTTSGGTCTTTVNALLLTRASATTGSGLRIPHGTAPTTPTNGDVWTDTAGFYARINGATVTLTPPTAATVAEAKAGTDTAKFISANVLQKVVNSPSYYKFPRGLLTGSTSGTGASVASGALITNIIGTTTGAGWAQYKYYGISGIDIVNATGWRVGGQSIDFSKKFRLTGSTNMLGALPTNTIVRVMFGKNANDGGGDPTQRCIGWRYNQATGFIEIIAHNGTTLSTLTTASNPAASSWFEWELYNDGAGNVQMFVNDTSIGTVTGGPVSPDFGSAPTYVEEVQCTATPSAQPQVRFRNGGLFLQP